jgi:hypothetical protein
VRTGGEKGRTDMTGLSSSDAEDGLEVAGAGRLRGTRRSCDLVELRTMIAMTSEPMREYRCESSG